MGHPHDGIDHRRMGQQKAEATNKIRRIWVGISLGSMGTVIKAKNIFTGI